MYIRVVGDLTVNEPVNRIPRPKLILTLENSYRGGTHEEMDTVKPVMGRA
ncbi:hypothetical protein [Thermococcus sp.]